MPADSLLRLTTTARAAWYFLTGYSSIPSTSAPCGLAPFPQVTPKFCKQYARVGDTITAALQAYRQEVEERRFPGPRFSPYSISQQQVRQPCHVRLRHGMPLCSWCVKTAPVSKRPAAAVQQRSCTCFAPASLHLRQDPPWLLTFFAATRLATSTIRWKASLHNPTPTPTPSPHTPTRGPQVDLLAKQLRQRGLDIAAEAVEEEAQRAAAAKAAAKAEAAAAAAASGGGARDAGK